MNPIKDFKFNQVLTDTTGAQGTTGVGPSAVVDMQGWDGVVFIGAVDANANTTGGLTGIQAQYSDSTSTTDMVSDTDARAIGTTASPAINDAVLLLEIDKPLKRYISAESIKDTTNAVRVDITAMRYKGRKFPVTQDTSSYGVIASAQFISPTT